MYFYSGHVLALFPFLLFSTGARMTQPSAGRPIALFAGAFFVLVICGLVSPARVEAGLRSWGCLEDGA